MKKILNYYLQSKVRWNDLAEKEFRQHCANGTATEETEPIGHQRGGTYQTVRVARSKKCAS